jgi:hypothetical protein
MLILSRSIKKHGHHRQFLFLIGRFKKIFSSETAFPNELKFGRKHLQIHVCSISLHESCFKFKICKYLHTKKHAICIHIHFVIHVYVLYINTVGKKLALKKQNSKLISIYNYCNKNSA